MTHFQTDDHGSGAYAVARKGRVQVVQHAERGFRLLKGDRIELAVTVSPEERHPFAAELLGVDLPVGHHLAVVPDEPAPPAPITEET